MVWPFVTGSTPALVTVPVPPLTLIFWSGWVLPPAKVRLPSVIVMVRPVRVPKV